MDTGTTKVKRASRRGLWLIGLGSVFFGFTGVTSKTLYARTEITSLGVSWLRMVVAAVALLVLMLHRSGKLPQPRSARDWFLLLALGLSVAGYQVTFFGGIQRSTVTTVTLIAMCTAPVIVALLAPLFLGERVTWAMWVALACAVAGTALLVQSGERASLSSAYLVGNLLALGSAFSYASFMLLSKIAVDWLGTLAIIMVAFCVAAVLLAPVAVGDVLAAGLGWVDWLYILWLGLGATALAYGLLVAGMPYASATAASIVTLLEPLTATILASVFFQERLGATGLVGAALLLAGMLVLYQRGG